MDRQGPQPERRFVQRAAARAPDWPLCRSRGAHREALEVATAEAVQRPSPELAASMPAQQQAVVTAAQQPAIRQTNTAFGSTE